MGRIFGGVIGFLVMFLYSAVVWAGAAQWSSTNVQYLIGDTYTNVSDDTEVSASIITLEHVNGWKYGDNFYFVDITNPDRADAKLGTSFYGELSPRLSFGKMFGADLSAGFFKDVLLTTTAEIGNGFQNYLYGVAVDLNIPKTPVFQINAYVRNENRPDTDPGYQVTLVWLTPFNIGGASFAFEGFFDYAFDMDHAEDNIITAPRLLMDLGKTWGSPEVLQVGIEYQIWRNKYGIDGIDEDVPQAMVKWIW
jgi:nucleoside-specific outer membrane channel protein Tsx